VTSETPEEPQSKQSGLTTFATIDLAESDYRGYYNGFANGMLWPLLHSPRHSDRDGARSARPGADRHPHLFVRPHWRGAEDESGRSPAEGRRVGAPVARERRQASRHALRHHALAEALRAYIDAATIAEDRKGFLFRTSRGHRGTELSTESMGQPDEWRMIRRRAVAVSIHAPIVALK
jgi:hypothetical protein